jgi:hypothetical protein
VHLRRAIAANKARIQDIREVASKFNVKAETGLRELIVKGLCTDPQYTLLTQNLGH